MDAPGPSAPMTRRDPAPHERNELREAVRRAAWVHARHMADLSGDQGPWSIFDDGLDTATQRSAELAMLAALRDTRAVLDELIEMSVYGAGDLDAGGPAIGAALKISPQAVRKRWPSAVPNRPGPRPRTAPGRSGPRVSDEVVAVAGVLHRLAFDWAAPPNTPGETSDSLHELALSLDNLAASLTGAQDRAAVRGQLDAAVTRIENLPTSSESLAQRLREAAQRIVAPQDQPHAPVGHNCPQ